MNTMQHQPSRPSWIVLTLLAALASSGALAAGKSATLDPKCATSVKARPAPAFSLR
jgi:hypothetical protein